MLLQFTYDSVPVQAYTGHFFDVHPFKNSNSEGSPETFNPYDHVSCFQELEGSKDPYTNYIIYGNLSEIYGRYLSLALWTHKYFY